MTWTVEEMKLGPVLGIISWSHFWPPKITDFSISCQKTSHPEQDLGSSDGNSGIIWNRSGVVLGFVLVSFWEVFCLGSGIVLMSFWGRSSVLVGSF